MAPLLSAPDTGFSHREHLARMLILSRYHFDVVFAPDVAVATAAFRSAGSAGASPQHRPGRVAGPSGWRVIQVSIVRSRSVVCTSADARNASCSGPTACLGFTSAINAQPSKHDPFNLHLGAALLEGHSRQEV